MVEELIKLLDVNALMLEMNGRMMVKSSLFSERKYSTTRSFDFLFLFFSLFYYFHNHDVLLVNMNLHISY